jgi:hypothetical protein
MPEGLRILDKKLMASAVNVLSLTAGVDTALFEVRMPIEIADKAESGLKEILLRNVFTISKTS